MKNERQSATYNIQDKRNNTKVEANNIEYKPLFCPLFSIIEFKNTNDIFERVFNRF